MPLATTGRPSAHDSSATIDRLSKYDGMISRSAAAIASNLSASSRKPRWRIRGCWGIGSSDWPISRSDSLPESSQIRLEKLEQLLTALVLVNAADVDRKSSLDAVLLPESIRLRVVRNFRPDAHDDPGHVVIARDRLNHRLLFGRVVHQRPHASKERLKQPKADRRIALGGRHEDRPRGRGPRSVIRLVVPVAEEQTEVVRPRRARRRVARAPGSSVLRRRAIEARRRANAAVRTPPPIAG